VLLITWLLSVNVWLSTVTPLNSAVWLFILYVPGSSGVSDPSSANIAVNVVFWVTAYCLGLSVLLSLHLTNIYPVLGTAEIVAIYPSV
jgi:hypothetical protein